MAYDQSGNYTVIASLVVALANKFFPGLGVSNDTVVTIIVGLVAIYGVAKSFLAHRNLAQSAGVYPKA